MESTGYEALNRRPGGDRRFTNGDTRSSGKTLPSGSVKNLPYKNGGASHFTSHGESRPTKSKDLQSDGSFHSCGNSRPTSRRELQAEMAAVRSPVVLHPATPGSIGKPGARKESPAASPMGSQQFVDTARNVRRRPSESTPYNLRYIDTHAEDIFVHKNKTNEIGGSKTLPNMALDDVPSTPIRPGKTGHSE